MITTGCYLKEPSIIALWCNTVEGFKWPWNRSQAQSRFIFLRICSTTRLCSGQTVNNRLVACPLVDLAYTCRCAVIISSHISLLSRETRLVAVWSVPSTVPNLESTIYYDSH